MTSSISDVRDDRVFFVNIVNPKEPEREGYEVTGGVNPIAQGFVAAYQPDDKGRRWGVLSWFDKINSNMRSIEIKAPPTVDSEKKLYEATSVEDITYRFRYLDKIIYDRTVSMLSPFFPPLEDDTAVQKYIMDSNPYL
jgi:hypothetical protein